MADFRFSVSVDVDITNAESESEARKAAFALLTAPETQKKGRPSSGPRGMVTGITIETPVKETSAPCEKS